MIKTIGHYILDHEITTFYRPEELPSFEEMKIALFWLQKYEPIEDEI